MPEDTPKPPAGAEPPQDPDTIAPRHRRGRGTVAHLPYKVRNRLGELLLDGHTYKAAVELLGEDGKELAPEHVGRWVQFGGFESWKLDYNSRESLRNLRGAAVIINEDKPAAPIQEAGRAVASGQLYELLHSFDPASFPPDKPELYLRLVTALSRLSEAESLCSHRRVQQALAEMKLDRPEAFDPKKMYTGDQLKEILRNIKVL